MADPNPSTTQPSQTLLAAAGVQPPPPRPPSDEAILSVFQSEAAFKAAQRMAMALVTSDIVPENYRGEAKLGNALVALEISQRNRCPILAVMQNLYVVHGRPAWSSQFVIASLNTCGRFEPLEFEWVGEKGTDEYGCRAYTTVKKTGRPVQGSLITIGIAKAEGWYGRTGSKWKTMPEQMLMYRAASFFGKIYAPEVLNGMQTVEENEDAIDVETIPVPVGSRPALPPAASTTAALPSGEQSPPAKEKETKGVAKATKSAAKREQDNKDATSVESTPVTEKKPEEKPAPPPPPVEEKKPETTVAAPAAAPVQDELIDETVTEEKKPAGKPEGAVEVRLGTKGVATGGDKSLIHTFVAEGEFAGKVYLRKEVYEKDGVPNVGEDIYLWLRFQPIPNSQDTRAIVTAWRPKF